MMTTRIARARRVKALGTSVDFWIAMLAASALGTNLGDLWTGHLGISGPVAFTVLVIICAGAIWADRTVEVETEIAYWVAIVLLRAAATNIADLLTEQLSFDVLLLSAGLAILTLLCGKRTRPVVTGGAKASPMVDGRYWTAMFIGGVFGTVVGDFVSHSLGLMMSAVILTALLAGVVVARERLFAASMVSYWSVVLAERAAGTPIGDGLASRHGVALGLPLATCCSAIVFAAALSWRARRGVVGAQQISATKT